MTLRTHPDEIVAASASQLLAIAPWWKRVQVGDVAEVTNGAPFRSEEFNNARRGLPLIRIRDVGRSMTSVHYAGVYEKRHVVQSGDLLIGMDGDFRIARWKGEVALLNQRVCRLRVRDKGLYNEGFLSMCIQPYLDAVHAVTSSITVKHLSSRTIEDLPVPLPPRAEQERIVAVIEEHFPRLDAAEAVLQSSERRIGTLEKAILIEASAVVAPLTHWKIVTVADAGSVGLGLQRSPKRHNGPNMRPYLRVANVFKDSLSLIHI